MWRSLLYNLQICHLQLNLEDIRHARTDIQFLILKSIIPSIAEDVRARQ